MTSPESLFGSKESYEKLKRIIDQARLDPAIDLAYSIAEAELKLEDLTEDHQMSHEEMMEFVQTMQHENELYRLKKLSGI